MQDSYTLTSKFYIPTTRAGEEKAVELGLQCFVSLNKETLYLNDKYILYKNGKMLVFFNLGHGLMWAFYITFGEDTVFVCLK